MSDKHNFKVGDRIRIRKWEDMEREFGFDKDGDIRTNHCFTRSMRELCGLTATITDIEHGSFYLTDWSDNRRDITWFFSADMLELIEESSDYRSCDNCKHEDVSSVDYPCKVCDKNGGNEDKWESINSVNDPVNRPSHYTDGKIEVIEFIEDKKLGFCLGNAIKYIARAGKKNPDKTIEDINKAIWYLNRYIKELEEGLV